MVVNKRKARGLQLSTCVKAVEVFKKYIELIEEEKADNIDRFRTLPRFYFYNQMSDYFGYHHKRISYMIQLTSRLIEELGYTQNDVYDNIRRDKLIDAMMLHDQG